MKTAPSVKRFNSLIVFNHGSPAGYAGQDVQEPGSLPLEQLDMAEFKEIPRAQR
jgi:hypothetical protein